MAFTYGFFNAVGDDRRYTALQFGEMFDGLITDGVYPNVGTCFAVTPSSDLTVIVGPGKAWFSHAWALNENGMPIDLGLADLLLPRIDAIVLDIDLNLSGRRASIEHLVGEPATTPQRPSLLKSATHSQYPIAYVSVKANAASLSTADITNMAGTADFPYVGANLTTNTIENVFKQWQHEFEVWLQMIKDTSNETTIVHLLQQLEAIQPTVDGFESRIASLETALKNIQSSS